MVGYRAAKYYAKVSETISPLNGKKYNAAIDMFPDAVIAGSDFPDFLYAIPALHDGGEAAHWPPFHAAAIRYVRNLTDFKSGNWTDDTASLVAFLYGVSVHYVADEYWEGLNSQISHGVGFVEALSAINLDHPGTSDADETPANMAGDFDIAWSFDESGILPWKRYYPLQHIVNIYHADNFPAVTLADMQKCKLLFDLGLWAEKNFGGLLFLLTTEVLWKVPFAAERLLDFPVSGIDDMAIYVLGIWNRLAKWFDRGPPANPPPRRRRTSGEEDDLFTSRLYRAVRPFEEHAEKLMGLTGPFFDLSDPENPLEGGLVYTGPKDDIETKLLLYRILISVTSSVAGFDKPSGLASPMLALRDRSPALEKRREMKNEDAAASAQLNGSSPVGYFGSEFAAGDFDGDGATDLVIGAYGVGEKGAPQMGSVHVRYGNQKVVNLTGTTVHGRFGYSLASLDFNLDGITDLVVGAPLSGDDFQVADDSYPAVHVHGKVFIFLGQKGAGLPSSPSITIDGDGGDLTAFGSKLFAADIDSDGHDDLVVGCPFYSDGSSVHPGRVFAFTSAPAHSSTMNASDAALDIVGPEYSWFGSSIGSIDGTLLVGAPGYRNATGATVGAVYAVSTTKTDSAVRVLIEGSERLGEFGSSIAVDPAKRRVAISSPAAGRDITARGGRVDFFSISRNSGQDDIELSRAGAAAGRSAFGRAGASISWPLEDIILISAPLGNAKGLAPSARELGKMYIYRIPKGEDMPESFFYLEDSPYAHAYAGTDPLGRFGSAFISLGNSTVVVGAPRAKVNGNEMAGKAFFFPLVADSK